MEEKGAKESVLSKPLLSFPAPWNLNETMTIDDSNSNTKCLGPPAGAADLYKTHQQTNVFTRPTNGPSAASDELEWTSGVARAGGRL